MVTLSAFGDEISDDLDEQMDALHAEGVGHVDVRRVGGRGVLDLAATEVRRVRETLDRREIGVASIASPIGKSTVDTPVERLRGQVEHAAVVAHLFGTPAVRIFSFYPPGQDGPAAPHAPVDAGAWRDAVLHRLRTMVTWARECGIILLVENDHGTFADTIDGARAVLAELAGDHLGMVFDAANFLRAGAVPYPDAYDTLGAWIRHVHVKDVAADGTMVPAGQGTARWPDLLRALRDAGYDGYLSLEPHLTRAGQFGGFTGPARFHDAAAALRGLLTDLDWKVG